MPSGAKKRKAAKKKMKNGEARKSNHHHSNSSSTHSQGSDDPKSFDDRESDSGEVEREEEEKGEARGEGEAVDHEECGGENRKGLTEEIVDIRREAVADVLKEVKHAENGSGDVDCSAVDIANDLTSEDCAPSNGGLEEKEVAIEEEKSMVAGLEELKGQDVPSVLESIPGDEIPKPVDFAPKQTIGVDSASVESVKDVVSLPQEKNVHYESSVTSDLVKSELMENAETALQISDEKVKFSSVMEDLQPQKNENKIAPMDEDKSLVVPPVNASSGPDAVKALEAVKQLEEQVVSPAATTAQMAENVKDGETLKQSDDEVGSTVVTTNHEVNNVKNMETQKQSMDQPLIGSNPLPVRRTSWTGCCGLFELFTGANR